MEKHPLIGIIDTLVGFYGCFAPTTPTGPGSDQTNGTPTRNNIDLIEMELITLFDEKS
jgi:hypothetical protein